MNIRMHVCCVSVALMFQHSTDRTHRSKDKVSGNEPKHDGEKFNAAQKRIFLDSFQLDQSCSIVTLDAPF